jgi:endoglucanase
MDSATIYKPELITKVVATARKHNISLQFRKGTAAANDAGNIHQASKGIPTITISVPCRNIHSFSSLIAESDYENCLKLVKAILGEMSLFCPKNIKN